MNCYARFSRRKKTILPAVCLGRNLSYLAFHSGCSFSSRSFHPIFGASRTVFFAPSSAFTARLLGRPIICVVTRWFCIVDWTFCRTSPVIVFFFFLLHQITFSRLGLFDILFPCRLLRYWFPLEKLASSSATNQVLNCNSFCTNYFAGSSLLTLVSHFFL